MRFKVEKEHRYWLLRVWNKQYTEVAYATLGLKGLQAEMEIPSDWHEKRRVWFRFGLGFGSVCFSVPWPKSWRVAPDEYQCSGPTYGFCFYEDLLWIRWGKDTGRPKKDPKVAIYMPWSWKHREHKLIGAPETHDYTYVLRSGEVQRRKATIQEQTRRWSRWWLPFRRVSRSIDIEFDGEVGERSGSWKGGCIGCSYEMQRGETPLMALRRMELERKF